MSDGREEDAQEASNPAADDAAHQFAELEARVEELAGRGGVAALAEKETIGGADILAILGGVRGLVETIVPGLIFIIAFALGQALGWPSAQTLTVSLATSLGSAVVFVGARILQRGTSRSAIAGLLGAAASAAIALFTGNPSDNFLLGLIINAVYGSAMLISVVVRWPLIGLVVGVLMSDGVRWRKHARRFRGMTWLTLLWAGLFGLRLAVELPLYLAGESQVVALGIAKLALGTPLYALCVVITWLVARALYPTSRSEAN
ncbi:MAG TPA: DUF3159 domain-containing protein [Microbacteriaceae bacterium]|nr:DUF3159 domain-containing protein [Microbacteriaceae bacterium]